VVVRERGWAAEGTIPHALASLYCSFELALVAFGVKGVFGGEEDVEHDTRAPHVDGAALVPDECYKNTL
jgi:hypothetical protein